MFIYYHFYSHLSSLLWFCSLLFISLYILTFTSSFLIIIRDDVFISPHLSQIKLLAKLSLFSHDVPETHQNGERKEDFLTFTAWKWHLLAGFPFSKRWCGRMNHNDGVHDSLYFASSSVSISHHSSSHATWQTSRILLSPSVTCLDRLCLYTACYSAPPGKHKLRRRKTNASNGREW